MMRTIELSTLLPANPDEVWDHVTRSALLHYVGAGFMSFRAAGHNFPERWTVGEHKAWLWLAGFIPMGWQVIRIEYPSAGDGVRALRDRGYGMLIKIWDHIIEVSRERDGARYVDRVSIEAGALTPIVAAFARIFYGHRQRRWRRLVANGFDYAK